MDSLEQYKLYLLRDKGLQTSTVATNLKLLKRLQKSADCLNTDSLSKFISKLIEERKNVNYINQYIVVAHYYGEVFKIDDLASYPLYKPHGREDDYLCAIMSDEEVDAFLTLPNPYPRGSLYWRRYELWSAFWYICAYHGCRMGEAASLRKIPIKTEQGHVDFGRNLIVFDGKTGPREVPMSFVVKEKLKKYISSVDGDYLFPCLHKNSRRPIVTDVAWSEDFWKRIKRVDKQLPGIATRLNLKPYSLRHSFGTRQADEDFAISKIQKAMGHSRLDTTQKYIHMSLKGVSEMIQHDRLSLPHKKGTEIAQMLVDLLNDADKKYRDKVFIDVKKNDKEGKKFSISLEVLD